MYYIDAWIEGERLQFRRDTNVKLGQGMYFSLMVVHFYYNKTGF